MKTNPNEPSNPVLNVGVKVYDAGRSVHISADEKYDFKTNFGGLTKREYFAAMAMTGIMTMVARGVHSAPLGAESVAKTAVQQADALIAELNKEA